MKTPSGDLLPGTDALQRHREIEIKLATDAEGLERVGGSDLLAGAKARSVSRQLKTVYYDTPSSDLWKNRTILRMRKAGRGYVMAVKWPLETHQGVFSRSEIEIAMAGALPDIDHFDASTAVRLREQMGPHALEAKFITQFKRRIYDLDTGHAVIEVALDEGFILAGDRREPLMEVELELKSGDAAGLYDAAMRLLRELPMRLGTLSKGERGFMMVDGQGPLSSKAANPGLGADATLDEAVEHIIGGSLDHFVRNMPALGQADTVEAVHQMRVALRRLRTSFALFDRVLPSPEFAAFREAARQLASALGPARDWDIFRELLAAGPCAASEPDAGFDALFAGADALRSEAYAAAQTAIEGPQSTRFVVGMQGFLARRAWRMNLDSVQLRRLTEKAADFAVRDIGRLRRRVLRRGENLLQAAPAERHKVRIALKQLRYALEFFGALLDPAQVRAQLKTVERLQGALGDYNDGVTAIRLVRGAEAQAGAPAAGASGVVRGWYAHATTRTDAALGKLWKRFRSMPALEK